MFQANKLILPTKCARCNVTFDLSNDIFIEEKLFDDFIQIMKMREMENNLLCKECM